MNELLSHIDKIHTTPLGAERVQKNLAATLPDVVEWCKEKIANADTIIRKGKNWYVYSRKAVITINAHSYTIITAHKNKTNLAET